MTNTQTQQKEQLKKTLLQEIDRYYEEMTEGLQDKTIKIDDIERMLGESKTKIGELIESATGEIVTSNPPDDKKKSVRTVRET